MELLYHSCNFDFDISQTNHPLTSYQVTVARNVEVQHLGQDSIVHATTTVEPELAVTNYEPVICSGPKKATQCMCYQLKQPLDAVPKYVIEKSCVNKGNV